MIYKGINNISNKMRSKAFLETYISSKRRIYGKRSKRRRFPFKRKYKKKSSRLSSYFRRRSSKSSYRKRKVTDGAGINIKDKAQEPSSNINELIENMSLLQL